jgi:hypothetical protein
MKSLKSILILLSLITLVACQNVKLPFLGDEETPRSLDLDLYLIQQLAPDAMEYESMSLDEQQAFLLSLKKVTDNPWYVAKLEEEIQKVNRKIEIRDTPEPTPDPEDQTPPSANESEEFFKQVRWLRSDPAAPDARVTKSLSNLEISGRNVFFEMDDLGAWSNQGDTFGVMAIAVNRSGTWEGGKFDHVRRDTRQRDFKNVGTYIAVHPRSGEPVRFWVINYAGTEASNYVETTWP